MKPFRYKLTAVQRVRDRREHEATEQYAHALAQRENAFRNLEVAERELATGQLECSRLLSDGATAGDLRRQQLGCAWLQEHRDQVEAILEQAEVRVHQTLGVMITARRESEAVKKHHDKARDSHQREQQREEQKTLDDLPLRTLARLIG